ncbi:DUF4340 domain-containing protein [Lyngbya aestuarii]|uniref:DUF4340 domain-containing protein n=1 Tax=Lyngbya aestuarii TaxID=118322 RepID=UPI00403E0416
MKLQRTTLVLLISAILLGGLVYVYEGQVAPKQEAAKATKQPLFSFEEDQIKSVTIYLDDETWEFEQVSQQEPRWRMKQPQDAVASSAAVAFLTNLLVDGESDRTFTVPVSQRQEYGLDKPMATVAVELKNQEVHQLILGKLDFNGSFLYGEKPQNRQSGQIEVLLVPKDFEYAVNRPLSEWLNQEETSETSEQSDSETKPPLTPEQPSETENKQSDSQTKPPLTPDKSSDTKNESSDSQEKPSATQKESPKTQEKPSDQGNNSPKTQEKPSDTKQNPSEAEEER